MSPVDPLFSVSAGRTPEVSFVKKKKHITGLVVLVSLLVFLAVPAWGRASVEDILDGRTAFHWGRNFLCWVVHYPEDIVEPWVRSQAGAGGDPSGKMAEGFRKSLRLDDSTPLLLSVHGFTAEPVLLKPLSERFYLELENGERVHPESYESVFDDPLAGLVQGLVFFPKVKGPFTPVLKAPSGRELAFEFPEERENRIRREEAQSLREKYDEAATAKKQDVERLIRRARREALEEAEDRWQEDLKELRMKLEEIAAQRDMLRKRLDKALAEAAAAKRQGAPADKLDSGAPENTQDSADVTQPDSAAKKRGWGRDQVVELFVVDWKKGDHESMRQYLSPALREEVNGAGSMAVFLKDKVLPAKLPSDAKVKDEGGESAKVVYANKVLFVRTLQSAELGLFRGAGGWFVGRIE
jgi:hypothetical protein